jgi:hypothetical protein
LSSLHVFKIDSEAHLASYPMGTRDKVAGSVTLTIQECVDLYMHSPLYLNGIVLNKLSKWTALPCSNQKWAIARRSAQAAGYDTPRKNYGWRKLAVGREAEVTAL